MKVRREPGLDASKAGLTVGGPTAGLKQTPNVVRGPKARPPGVAAVVVALGLWNCNSGVLGEAQLDDGVSPPASAAVETDAGTPGTTDAAAPLPVDAGAPRPADAGEPRDAGRAPDAPAPIDDVPPSDGDAFAQVNLHFQIEGAPPYDDWRYVGGMRNGRLVVDHGLGLRTPAGVLELSDDRLSGSFRRPTPENDEDRFGTVEITVDATLTGAQLDGTARVGDRTGRVTGTVVFDAELRAENDLDPSLAWPTFLGPHGGGMSGRMASTAALDPTAARLVWRSEPVDIGQGIGSCNRHMFRANRAANERTVSGSSSPVLAGGRVYLSYYVPTPTLPDPRQRRFSTGHQPYEAALAAMAEEMGRDEGEVPEYLREKIWEAVDDVIVALDAETGALRWKTRIPASGYNLQHHKEGPFNMTPAVHGDRVFAVGKGGDLFALDAADGRLLWQRSIGGERSHLSTALVALADVVVAPFDGVWVGFDAETGDERWRSELDDGAASLAVWPHEDGPFLIGGTGFDVTRDPEPEGILAVNAQTGATAWRYAFPAVPAAVNSTGRGAGPGGLTVHEDTLLAYVAETTGASRTERSENQRTKLVAMDLTTAGPSPRWEVSDVVLQGKDDLTAGAEHVPVVVRGAFVVSPDLRVIDLETGAQRDATTGVTPGNGGYMQALGDLLLVRRDGTHGVIGFTFYRIGPQGQITNLNPEDEWKPAFAGTTSYHHPIHYPLADGRMFVRQEDGVYCWDLREAP